MYSMQRKPNKSLTQLQILLFQWNYMEIIISVWFLFLSLLIIIVLLREVFSLLFIFAGLMFGEIANPFSRTESYLLLTDEESLLHHVSAIYLQLLQDDMQIWSIWNKYIIRKITFSCTYILRKLFYWSVACSVNPKCACL